MAGNDPGGIWDQYRRDKEILPAYLENRADQIYPASRRPLGNDSPDHGRSDDPVLRCSVSRSPGGPVFGGRGAAVPAECGSDGSWISADDGDIPFPDLSAVLVVCDLRRHILREYVEI